MLLGAFVWMFLSMGFSVIAHWNKDGLAELVTTYGTFLGIIGLLVGSIVKDLFNDGD